MIEGYDEIALLRLLCSALEEERLVLLAHPIPSTAEWPTRQRLSVHLVDESNTLLDERDFMPTAERFGIASELARVAICQAIGIAARECAVQIRVDAAAIADPDLLPSVEGELAFTGADPSLLVFELSAQTFEENRAMTQAFLDGVCPLGCGVAWGGSESFLSAAA